MSEGTNLGGLDDVVALRRERTDTGAERANVDRLRRVVSRGSNTTAASGAAASATTTGVTGAKARSRTSAKQERAGAVAGRASRRHLLAAAV